MRLTVFASITSHEISCYDLNRKGYDSTIRCSRQRNAPHFRKAIESFRCNPALTDESLQPATASSLQVSQLVVSLLVGLHVMIVLVRLLVVRMHVVSM